MCHVNRTNLNAVWFLKLFFFSNFIDTYKFFLPEHTELAFYLLKAAFF